MAVKNLGNVVGMYVGPNPPLEADGVTEKRYILWSQQYPTNPVTFELKYFNFSANNGQGAWVGLVGVDETEFSLFKFKVMGTLDDFDMEEETGFSSLMDLINSKLNYPVGNFDPNVIDQTLTFPVIDKTGASKKLNLQDLIDLIGGGGVFDEAWTVNIPNNPLGINGHVVDAGTEQKDFLLYAFRRSGPVTYTTPTAGFAGSSTSVSGIEIGETKAITVNGQFNQNDGGASTAHRIYKAGTKVADANTYTESIVFSNASVVFGYEADYGQGPIKNNDLGVPSPAGRIEAGTTNRASRTYTPVYKIFYGVAAAGLNTATYRTLNWVWDGTTSIPLATGTTLKDFYILVPANRTVTSIKDVESLNNELLSQFTVTTVNVPDAGGTNRSYKLYKWTAGNAYPSSHTLQITVA